jgi:NitT/TauT family transport system substrate-binding protein
MARQPEVGSGKRFGRHAGWILLLWSALIMVAGCGSSAAPAAALTPVMIQLSWTHLASIGAGFYAADQLGYYAQEGLAANLLQGGPQIDPITPVIAGQAQFGLATADNLILARAEGKPLRALATIIRRSPLVFIALANSGITRPQDFAGKTIRVTPNALPTLHAMTARVGIRRDQYTTVALPSDLVQFASGKVPVWAVYTNAFMITARQAGHKFNIIDPNDYGVRFYSESLFTTDELIATNPDLVRRMLRATLKGWTYAIEQPQMISALMVTYQPDIDTALQNDMMVASLPLINTGEDQIGWMRPEVWAGMAKTLREQGVLTKPVDPADV